MSFLDTPRFPVDISYGSRGGPGYRTNVITLKSGYEKRNVDWAQARYTFQVTYGVKTMDQLETLISFFHVAQGMANGFRYKDWSDYRSGSVLASATATDQTLGTGDGTTTTFQLIKKYTQGNTSRTRTISKPVDGTVLIAVAGSTTTNFTVNVSTGVVTMTSAPAAGASVTAGFEFDVPCRFDTDELSTSLDDYNIGSIDVQVVEIKL